MNQLHGSGAATATAPLVVERLSIAPSLADFVSTELLTNSRLAPSEFWAALRELVDEFGPRIAAALRRRDELQGQLDDWYDAHPGPVVDTGEYESFLRSIGYLVPTPGALAISTSSIDSEVSGQAGPQLVVPLTNPRFAANAANARWGSLYDALYGTDVIPRSGALDPGQSYNVERGAEVVRWGREFLDNAVPLDWASHHDAARYRVQEGQLVVDLIDGATATLEHPESFVAFRGEGGLPTAVLLEHHQLHIEIQIDRTDVIGAADTAGVRDILLESAVTTIMDLEDSVAAVDAVDKVVAYRTWARLLDGTLEVEFRKNGQLQTRGIAGARRYVRPDGRELALPGTALLFVRHTGHSMYTQAVLDEHGQEIPEGLLDLAITAAAAITDLERDEPFNSSARSLYIVKPKLHGPAEVELTVEMFAAVERLFSLPDHALKLGIMDEERRTTVNLRACVAAAQDRVVFINTGFLDRTGDEIHSSFHAGPVLRKSELRSHPYIAAYEEHNVKVGLEAGFAGRAQIGKGMWAMTEQMAAMVDQKASQLEAGASTAWVPSPTAATLHATHYHLVDVAAVQSSLAGRADDEALKLILTPPISDGSWTREEVQAELDDNLQSILGYVVRWIDQGIGCSKVPNLAGVELMEDRATLRISSQLMGNWLFHGVITEAQVVASMDRIARQVDVQNSADPGYTSLGAAEAPSLAYQASLELVLRASQEPNGYTERILHMYRRRRKDGA